MVRSKDLISFFHIWTSSFAMTFARIFPQFCKTSHYYFDRGCNEFVDCITYNRPFNNIHSSNWWVRSITPFLVYLITFSSLLSNFHCGNLLLYLNLHLNIWFLIFKKYNTLKWKVGPEIRNIFYMCKILFFSIYRAFFVYHSFFEALQHGGRFATLLFLPLFNQIIAYIPKGEKLKIHNKYIKKIKQLLLDS